MKKCKIKICDKKHYAKGWCERHYKQTQRNGYITNEEPVEKHTMCEDDLSDFPCFAPHYAKGYCKRHYEQVQVYGHTWIV